MTADTEENKIIMNAGDVSTLLDIKESTLRKYALILQDAGYHFQVNGKGQRAYFDRDVTVLRRFIEIKNSPDMTLEQAANAVISWLEQSNVSLSVISSNGNNKRYNEDIQELKEEMAHLKEVNRMLLSRLEEQQKYIEKRLDHHDDLLMNSLRESQEAKKLLLEAKEEEQKKPRKGLLRFFSKD